jgi:hypothetical protein
VSFLGNATGNRPETAGKKAGALPLPGLGCSAMHRGRPKYTAKRGGFQYAATQQSCLNAICRMIEKTP